jgi:hypothetical protein
MGGTNYRGHCVVGTGFLRLRVRFAVDFISVVNCLLRRSPKFCAIIPSLNWELASML